jgi:outer membrane protein
MVSGFASVVILGTTLNFWIPKADAQVTIPIILVIDRAQLLSESEAGKDIAEQAKALQETITKELQAEFDELKKEEEQLIAQQSLLAPEIIQERATKLQIKQRDFEVTQQVKNREFQATIANAQGEIGEALEPILGDIITERSGTLLIDRSNVMFAIPDINVTAEALKRLNENLKAVKLERVKLEVSEGGEVKETTEE